MIVKFNAMDCLQLQCVQPTLTQGCVEAPGVGDRSQSVGGVDVVIEQLAGHLMWTGAGLVYSSNTRLCYRGRLYAVGGGCEGEAAQRRGAARRYHKQRLPGPRQVLHTETRNILKQLKIFFAKSEIFLCLITLFCVLSPCPNCPPLAAAAAQWPASSRRRGSILQQNSCSLHA